MFESKRRQYTVEKCMATKSSRVYPNIIMTIHVVWFDWSVINCTFGLSFNSIKLVRPCFRIKYYFEADHNAIGTFVRSTLDNSETFGVIRSKLLGALWKSRSNSNKNNAFTCARRFGVQFSGKLSRRQQFEACSPNAYYSYGLIVNNSLHI